MKYFQPFTLPIPIGFTTACAVVIGRLPLACAPEASNDALMSDATEDQPIARLGLCPGMCE